MFWSNTTLNNNKELNEMSGLRHLRDALSQIPAPQNTATSESSKHILNNIPFSNILENADNLALSLDRINDYITQLNPTSTSGPHETTDRGLCEASDSGLSKADHLTPATLMGQNYSLLL